ncbi:hypothetical protein [Tardiphaga sp.]|uniref:hypothetical protein n=1 Tax=Tardiphaga sp. TaxID=1926292 RepID=UPI00352B1031
MFEQDIRIGRAFAVRPRGDVGKIGEEGDGPIDLVEDRVGEWRHTGHPGRITIRPHVAVGRIDVGIGIHRSDRAIECPLDEAPSNSIVRIALP